MFTGALVVATGACFPPSDLSTTCSIAGTTTTCGKCIASRCESEIGACCGGDDNYSSSCGESELKDLERCTTKKDCGDLLELCSPDASSYGGQKELAQCVVDHCASACGVSSAACDAPARTTDSL